MIANRLLLSRRDRVVGVGDAVREALIANEGFSRSRVEVLYNGIDVVKFSAANDRAEARRALQVADGEFVILQVARLDYLKDHGTALRTLARVLKSVPNARLALIGEGPEQSAIEQRVSEYRLGEAVRFLGTRTDVHRLLAGADVFLLTSLSEGIPLTVLEAMAARLPVVGTDVGGMSEVVVHGITGYLCRARDDVALADRIARIAGDSELRRRLGEAGYVRAAERFDEARMCADYERHYRELVACDNAIRPSSTRLTKTSPLAVPIS
jgi:glycosyltransferase involved in cell wall biosynthesis